MSKNTAWGFLIIFCSSGVAPAFCQESKMLIRCDYRGGDSDSEPILFEINFENTSVHRGSDNNAGWYSNTTYINSEGCSVQQNVTITENAIKFGEVQNFDEKKCKQQIVLNMRVPDAEDQYLIDRSTGFMKYVHLARSLSPFVTRYQCRKSSPERKFEMKQPLPSAGWLIIGAPA
jgi:hypothetical protein